MSALAGIVLAAIIVIVVYGVTSRVWESIDHHKRTLKLSSREAFLDLLEVTDLIEYMSSRDMSLLQRDKFGDDAEWYIKHRLLSEPKFASTVKLAVDYQRHVIEAEGSLQGYRYCDPIDRVMWDYASRDEHVSRVQNGWWKIKGVSYYKVGRTRAVTEDGKSSIQCEDRD